MRELSKINKTSFRIKMIQTKQNMILEERPTGITK